MEASALCEAEKFIKDANCCLLNKEPDWIVKVEPNSQFDHFSEEPLSQPWSLDDDDDDLILQDFVAKTKLRKSETIPTSNESLHCMPSSFADGWDAVEDDFCVNGDSIFDLDLDADLCVVLDCPEESSISARKRFESGAIADTCFLQDPSYSPEITGKVGRNLRKKRVVIGHAQKLLELKEVSFEDEEDDWTLERWKQQFSFSMSGRKVTSDSKLSSSKSIQEHDTKRQETEQQSGVEQVKDWISGLENPGLEGLFPKDQSCDSEILRNSQKKKKDLIDAGFDIRSNTSIDKAQQDSQDLVCYTPNEYALIRSEQVDTVTYTLPTAPNNQQDQCHVTDENLMVLTDASGESKSTYSACFPDPQAEGVQEIKIMPLDGVTTETLPSAGSTVIAGECIYSLSSLQKSTNSTNLSKDGLASHDKRARNFISSGSLRELCRSMIHSRPAKVISASESDCDAPIDSFAGPEFNKHAPTSHAPSSDAEIMQVDISPNFNRVFSEGHLALQQDKLTSKCRNLPPKGFWSLANGVSKEESLPGVIPCASVSKLLSKRKVKFDLKDDDIQEKRGCNSGQKRVSREPDSKLNAPEHFLQIGSDPQINSSNMRTAPDELCPKHVLDVNATSCHLSSVHLTGSPLPQEHSPDSPTKFSLVLTSSPSPPHNDSLEVSPDSPMKQSLLGGLEDPRPIRGILKQSLQHSVCNCPECQSIRSRAERAAKFSQRQWHDIQGLAGVLMKELRNMRSFVEDSLVQKVLVASELEQMRLATNSAMEAENTAKKWLVKMVRDCNRYCKIQETRKRKITFADEAGKQLCHVKHYQQNAHSEEHLEVLQLNTTSFPS